MNHPNPRTHRAEYLSSLRESDESLDDLLSSGADIDDLIEAGIVDGDEKDDDPDAQPETGSSPVPIAPF
jgi:hypothetical protein